MSEQTKKTKAADQLSYPTLPLRDIVVFPSMVVSLFVGRQRSKRSLEAAMKSDNKIFLVTQKDHAVENPTKQDLYEVGTLANIVQLLRSPDDTLKILVEGGERVKMTSLDSSGKVDYASVKIIEDQQDDPIELEALARSTVVEFESYVNMNKKIPPEVLSAISDYDDAQCLADTIMSHLSCTIEEKQSVLMLNSASKRLKRVLKLMENEVHVLEVERKIRGRVKRQMERSQREYYLNEQMKAIQKELGDEDGNEFEHIKERIKSVKLSKEAREKAEAELKKLRSMGPMSAEASVVRNYLDWMLSLPWGKSARVKKDLSFAERVLDDDHYGLEKVKERIIEYLAVQKRTNKLKGPIICLVGPPGVGKTSLGKSIAKATGREFVRFSLGGVRDEAEIRGHRRTYVGSMPGKVIQSLRKAKSVNPLFLLDEVDKMGMDYRGDPSSALLEVLDPEQNNTFNDHYLEVDYDLSKVMFITTSNTLNIPAPLLDRMEIIRISGYTEEEKLEIARNHLLPKTMSDHGVKNGEVTISDETLIHVIRCYTKEAGVRSLERQLAKLARKSVTRLVKDDKLSAIELTKDIIEEMLSAPPYRYGEREHDDQVGIVTGLAWTEVGGELLTIEGVIMPGKGKMTVTGNLRDVMKESISAANAYVRSRAIDFGIEPPLFDRRDIHVHVPEGATPKDGPSAGIAMATAIISVMTGIPVLSNVAMTGEVTLRGRVLPIGGLKEKLLAALRGGITKVLIPEENIKDLADIPDVVKERLEIVPVSGMSEVTSHALARKPEPIAWQDHFDKIDLKQDEESSEDLGTRAH